MNLTRRKLLPLAAAIGFVVIQPTAHAQAVLNAGAYPNNPPFEFKNKDGHFEGFDVDIVTEAAKRIGVDLNVAEYDFPPLFSATSSGRIDIAIASITITKDRLESHSFTQPYYDADMGVATRKDSQIRGVKDLKGKVVGVQSGSTGETWVRQNQASNEIADVKGYNEQQQLLLDLLSGRVDAMVSDVPGMEYAFIKMKDLEVREHIKSGDQYGLMMTKDSPLFVRVNDAIGAMKRDGTMEKLHEKWFGSKPIEGSSTITELEIPRL
ncbi:ABC transporter substrate-binding protein [Mesorhizobium sp. IMUNJ 23232]|uniref:ABC transporter substrate-binding protein n=1 Tax=Mesorhizobium sp. IMUNJ 23232 TaxID=3376064 RepID=UPI0037B882D2